MKTQLIGSVCSCIVASPLIMDTLAGDATPRSTDQRRDNDNRGQSTELRLPTFVFQSLTGGRGSQAYGRANKCIERRNICLATGAYADVCACMSVPVQEVYICNICASVTIPGARLSLIAFTGNRS